MAAAGDGEGDGGQIGTLPEDCISHVLSLTSPRDACRSAAVSAAFLSAAASDVVWGRFLPPDCGEVLALSTATASSPGFASKKELYLRLCDSVLIDDGRKIFALERSTGRKCYTLSARDLVVVWGDSPNFWRWIHLPESRFPEVAELLNVCWLEIRGKIECRMLSPKTIYAAYLIFKLAEVSDGLTYPNQEASIKVGSHMSKEAVCLHPLQLEAYWRGRVVRFRRIYPRPAPPPPSPASVADERRRVPRERGDGWMEILIGEFFNDEGDDGEVDISLMETQGGHWKTGLIVEGIEIRPKT